MGGYANGFKTTTSQWLAGSETSELKIDDTEYDSEGTISTQVGVGCGGGYDSEGTISTQVGGGGVGGMTQRAPSTHRWWGGEDSWGSSTRRWS